MRRSGRRESELTRSTRTDLDTLLAIWTFGAYTASRYRIDSATGKVGGFGNWLGTDEFAQTDTAKQCVVPTKDALLRSQPSANFAGAQYYQSSLAAASWKPWHDGTGGSRLDVFVPTAAFGYYAATRAAAAATGVLHAFNTAGNYVYQVHRGAVTVVSVATGTPVLNVASQVYASYWDTASGGPAGSEYVLDVTGAAAATGDSASTPDAGNPSASMMLGARTDGTFPAPMRWWGSFFRATRPSAADLLTSQQAIFRLTGAVA